MTKVKKEKEIHAMKKLLALILSLMMILSLVACGGEEKSSKEDKTPVEDEVTVEDETTTEDEVADDEEFVEFTYVALEVSSLADVPLAEEPELAGTTWNFAGAMMDGKEVTAEEAAGVLTETYSGTLQFVFDGKGGVQMIQGTGSLAGTYEFGTEGGLMATFDNAGTELKYACCFTEIDGTPILVALPDDSGTTGIYFIQ